jgi:hypothetical protein
MRFWGSEQGLNAKRGDSPSEPGTSACNTTATPNAAWKFATSLALAGSILIVAGGAFHQWRKPASRNTAELAPKSQEENFFGGLLPSLSPIGSPQHHSQNGMATNVDLKVHGTSLSLPLFFEANRGQTDARAKFLARSSGYTLFVTPTETIFAGARNSVSRGLPPQAGSAAANEPGPAVLRMKLLQGNPGPQVLGAKELPGRVNYLIGNNPRDWHTGIPLYEEVRSREVYPGIDLVFHGNQQQLEYDFQVSPGADPGRIRFKVSEIGRAHV